MKFTNKLRRFPPPRDERTLQERQILRKQRGFAETTDEVATGRFTAKWMSEFLDSYTDFV